MNIKHIAIKGCNKRMHSLTSGTNATLAIWQQASMALTQAGLLGPQMPTDSEADTGPVPPAGAQISGRSRQTRLEARERIRADASLRMN